MIAAEKLAELAPLLTPGTGWVELPRFPGYLIGIHGQVISTLVPKPRVLTPSKKGNYDGYQLRDADGVLRHVYRHRLVCEVIHGPCPPGMECRHIDGNRANNDFTNLRWGTPAENAADQRRHGTAVRGERCGVSKLTDTQVAEMRRTRQATGASYKALAAQFGVSTMTAYRAVTKQSWEHVQ